MNLAPSGIGAEPKKLAILIVLLLAAGGTYYWMSRPDVPAGAGTGPASAASVKTSTAPAPLPAFNSTARSSPASTSPSTKSSYGPRTSGRGRTAASGDDFRPTLKVPEGMDLSRVDPTLKLDLLAKVRNVPVAGGARSLFEFYTPPPPPPPPPPKVNPINPDAAKLAAAKQLEAEKAKAQPAPPPLIPLKFYGYSGALRSTVRRAFFLDGDDIVQAGENETIRNRYKIIRIGVNSAVVEDLIAKNQQTLALADEAQ